MRYTFRVAHGLNDFLFRRGNKVLGTGLGILLAVLQHQPGMVSGTGQQRFPGLFLILFRSITNSTFEGRVFETHAVTDIKERSKLGAG